MSVESAIASPEQEPDLVALQAIERRVLWLAVRMVDHANRERPNPDGIKVGGHQASSASLVSVMTALWFHHLAPEDRVAVKPHAAPVLHAIQYLLGHLDRSDLTSLRAFGGLQAYPSRTKDPGRVDFSTGSVGLGAVAPLFAAVVRRYVDLHFGPRPASRFISLLGDAELDEGNVWEAVNDPITRGLGNVMWVVDFNRQSLDRVVPGVRIAQWRALFEAAGWHVVEAKYGSRLLSFFTSVDGEAVRGWIDEMPNERYQSLFGLPGDQARRRFLEGAPDRVRTAVTKLADDDLLELVGDLGGHDLSQLLAAYEACDRETDRPSVVFAYTVKGWRLPFAGDPRNHGALMTGEQIEELREQLDVPDGGDAREWERLPRHEPAGRLAAGRGELLSNVRRAPEVTAAAAPLRQAVTFSGTRPLSTQAAFGRVVTALHRVEDLGERLVTTAPDVATTTNLAGFINRAGVFAPEERPQWSDDSLIEWHEGPSGQHLELGIGEMNFFLLLGQLGLAGDLSGVPLVPIGTVYDPFVLRGLDAFVYSAYSESRFILAGTPSGVTLAAEGGAHQSILTASVGLELPNVTFIEPAYAQPLDWLLCDAVGRLRLTPPGVGAGSSMPEDPDGAYYFRLTTRPLDQEPFERARDRLGDTVVRRQVLAGAYRLHEATVLVDKGALVVNLAASGAVLPEVLAAARELAEEGVAAHVIEVTSADRLYRAWRASHRAAIRHARVRSLPEALHGPFAGRAPVVTIHDASSHAMAWLGSALGVEAVSLGVDAFGESGGIQDLYRCHDLQPGMIVNAALATLVG